MSEAWKKTRAGKLWRRAYIREYMRRRRGGGFTAGVYEQEEKGAVVIVNPEGLRGHACSPPEEAIVKPLGEGSTKWKSLLEEYRQSCARARKEPYPLWGPDCVIWPE